MPFLQLDLSQDALSPPFLQQDFFAWSESLQLDFSSSDFLQQDFFASSESLQVDFASSDFLQQDFFASSDLQQDFFTSGCSSASIALETATDFVVDSGAS